MKILIAPDKFKGSLSATQVCDAITKGIKINKIKHEIISCPMADGGEGSIDILKNYLSLKPIELIPTKDNGSLAALTYGGTSLRTNDPPEIIECLPTLTNWCNADKPPTIAKSPTVT